MGRRHQKQLVAMFRANAPADDHPPHPGEILREDILPHLTLSRAELAQRLGLSARTLGEIINERRAVSLDIARRLGAALGQGARYWLSLQAQYDMWLAAEPVPAPVQPIAWGKRQQRSLP